MEASLKNAASAGGGTSSSYSSMVEGGDGVVSSLGSFFLTRMGVDTLLGFLLVLGVITCMATFVAMKLISRGGTLLVTGFQSSSGTWWQAWDYLVGTRSTFVSSATTLSVAVLLLSWQLWFTSIVQDLVRSQNVTGSAPFWTFESESSSGVLPAVTPSRALAIAFLAISVLATFIVDAASRVWPMKTEKGALGPGRVVNSISLFVAVLATGVSIHSVYTRLKKREAWPSAWGLFFGLGAVAVAQALMMFYAYMRHCEEALVPPPGTPLQKLELSALVPGPYAVDKQKRRQWFWDKLKEQVSRPESYVLLAGYLSVTWMFNLMPESYYSFLDEEGNLLPPEWSHVLLQMVVIDFFMFAFHVVEHLFLPFYARSHKKHHNNKRPTLFEAFSANLTDVAMLILVPMYTTAVVLEPVAAVNTASYAAFGSLYSVYMLMIHSGFQHYFDPTLHFLGFMTSATHHVHHARIWANFGHICNLWDILAGTYRAPERILKGYKPTTYFGTVGKREGESQESRTTRGGTHKGPKRDGQGLHKIGTSSAGASTLDKNLKQGAYGKVQIFQQSTLKSMLLSPYEAAAVFRFKMWGLPGIHKGELPIPSSRNNPIPETHKKAAKASALARCEVSHSSAPNGAALSDDIRFCGNVLDKVSRSFAVVIRQLPSELALPVAVFYLVLRALDTVEDEMAMDKFVPLSEALGLKGSGARMKAKMYALCQLYFYLGKDDAPCLSHGRAALEGPSMIRALAAGGVGEAAEARLLRDFEKVVHVFRRCMPAEQQTIIADVCKEMGEGMASFVDIFAQRDAASIAVTGKSSGNQGTRDRKEFLRYCHIVAGLVGEGLTRQFHACGLEKYKAEDVMLARGEGQLASDMGVFLQQTNIIRDFLEDLVEGRAWYPREDCWKTYAAAALECSPDEVEEVVIKCSRVDADGEKGGEKDSTELEKLWLFTLPEWSAEGDHAGERMRRARLAMLNELIGSALALAPRCIEYMSQLSNSKIIRFCAVPQVMAMATMCELYNNDDVFRGVIKVRKPLACRIMMECDSCGTVLRMFAELADEVGNKLHSELKGDMDNLSRLERRARKITLESLDAIRRAAGNGMKE